MTFETKQNGSVFGLARQHPKLLDNKTTVMRMRMIADHIYRGLLTVRHCAKYFKYFILFTPHSKFCKIVLIIITVTTL